jgi:hypothetical protein
VTIEEDYETVVAALEAIVRVCDASRRQGNMTQKEFGEIIKCVKTLNMLLKEKT